MVKSESKVIVQKEEAVSEECKEGCFPDDCECFSKGPKEVHIPLPPFLKNDGGLMLGVPCRHCCREYCVACEFEFDFIT